MTRNLLLAFALVTGSLAFSPAVSCVQACPMCKLANEEGGNTEAAAVANARPRAYMYSILFMLSMPAGLLSAYSLSFYRLHKRQQAQLAADGDVDAALAAGLEPSPA